MLLYLGTFGDQQPDKLEQEFKKLGVWSPSGQKEGTFQDELNKYSTAFGNLRRGRYSFSRIYEILEGLRKFAEE
jgi:hypothetical protein